MNDGKTWFGIGIDDSQLREDANRSMRVFDKIGDKAEAEGARIDKAFGNIVAGLVGTFSIGFLTTIATDVARVRNEFEQLEIAFKTMLGSKEKADALMRQAIDTAAKTPFDLNQVATGYKQLMAYGFEAEKLNETLVTLGDVASGVDAPLNDIVYLYGTLNASRRVALMDIRQFAGRGIPIYEELAKVLGIAKEQVNEFASEGKIAFKDIEQAFINMTSEGGRFDSLMEAQSASIGGMKANLEDAIDTAKNELGKKLEPIIKGAYKTAGDLIENYKEIGKTILGLAVAYGSYKAVLISIAAVQKLNMAVLKEAVLVRKSYAAQGIIITASEAAQQAQTNLLIAAKIRLIGVQKALNRAVLRNPYVIAATAVAALVFGIYKLVTAETAAEKAQRKHNEELEKAKEKKENLLSTTKRLSGIITDETKTIYQQVDAWRELKKEMPDTFGDMTLSEFKGLSGDEREKLMNKAADKKDMEDFNKSLEEAQSRVESLKKQMQDAMSAPNNSGAVMYLSRQLSIAHETLKLKQQEKKERDEIIRQAEFELKPDKEKLEILNQQLDSYRQQYIELENQIPETYRNVDAVGSLKKEVEFTETGIMRVNDEWGRFDAQTSLNIIQLNVLKKQMVDIENMMSGIKSAATKGLSYADAKKQAKENYDNSVKELENIKRNASKYTQKEFESAKKNAEEAKKAYEELGGVTRVVSTPRRAHRSTVDTRLQKERELAEFEELQDKLKTDKERYAVDAENAVEQARINAMEDGVEKITDQMKLNHKKELEELEREQKDYLKQKIEADKSLFEADPKNKKKVYKGAESVALTDEEKANFEVREKYIKEKQEQEREAILRAQKQAMNEYLAEYGEYMQRREAITELYRERIKKATTEGEKLKLGEEMRKELAAVDDEVQKRTSIITRIFADMSKKSVEDMRKLADEAQALLDFIGAGKYSSDNSFGITKEQFSILSKSPEKLKDIKDEIFNIRKEADASETALNKMSNGLKKIFGSKNNTKKLKEGLSEIESGLSEVVSGVDFLSGAFSNLGDAFGSDTLSGISEGLSMVSEAAGSAMEGAKAGAMFGLIEAAAGAAIGLVTSLAKNLSKLHDAKHEKKIQKMQGNIDSLQISYENLANKIDKAYSKDASKMIEQQNVMLKQQQILIRQQIEQEKQKKKADKDKIAEYERIYDELNMKIEDNKEKAVDAMFGEDIKSAIDNFADAYVKAWEAGDDKMKSSKDLAKKMIKSMVIEAIKSNIGDGFMSNLRAKMKEFLDNDGRISETEQAIIDNMVENYTKRLDNQYAWADKYLSKDEVEKQGAASYGAYEKITQDQAERIDGRLTGIHMIGIQKLEHVSLIAFDTEEIKNNATKMSESLTETRNIAITAVGHLEKISKNTSELYEMNERLGKIERNTSRL